MATSDFVVRLEKALENLVTLKIVTAVAPTALAVAEDGSVSSLAVPGNAKVIWTSMNLVAGNMTTVVDPAFQGADDPLLAFHKEREQQATAIVRGNVEALRGLVALLDDAYTSLAARPKELTPKGAKGP